MKRIYKYRLSMDDDQQISIPRPAKVLSVIYQDRALVLYAIVEDGPGCNWEYEKITVFIRGTGHPLGAAGSAHFVGTVATPQGFVWHVFYRFEFE